MNQLGLLEHFFQRPHNRLDRAELRIAGRGWLIGALSHLDTPAPFIAMMPQWEFLDFLRDEAANYPGFQLEMNAEVVEFILEEGRVAGVRLAGGAERRARLVIAADGRSSLVRREQRLPLEVLGVPIDVFWFRLPKISVGTALRASAERGRLLVMIDRGDYWQCAFVIPKGRAAELTAGGVGPIREAVAATAPELDVRELRTVDELKLLSVALDRLTCWQRPGLLAIGDAAHAMSPIGGVGINLAVQDAVAAANLLAAALAAGENVDDLLPGVQQRRLLPTKLVQAAQKAAQERILGRLLGPGPPLEQAPWLIRLLDRMPLLRRIPGRMIGLGVRRERVQSPNAYAG